MIVEVPGMGRVEFPDTMSDTDIAAAIQRNKPNDITEDVGKGRALAISAGKGAQNIIDGFTQLYLGARGEDSALGALKGMREEEWKAYKPLQEKHPLLTSVGESLPMFALPAGGGGMGLLAKAGAGGAAYGAAGYGDLQERLKNSAVGGIGAMAGAGLGMGVSRLLKPSGAGSQGLGAEARAAADRLGVRLSPGQKTQNPAMQNFENYLSRSPGSSGPMQAAAGANREAIDKAAAKTIGQTELGEKGFAEAKKQIGGEFQRLQGITSPKLENDFLNTLVKIDVANAEKGSFRNAEVDKLVNKGLDLAAQGKLTGTAYKEIRTELSDASAQAFKNGDAALGRSYKAVRSALDDAAKKSLPQAEQQAWEQTRAQWQAYKKLTEGMVSEGGSVSPARLAGALRRDGDGLRTGAHRALFDIGRLGESVKSVQNPNSGLLMNQAMYSNPVTGLPMAAANRLSEAVYNTGPVRSYLSGGVDLGPIGELLLRRSALPLGAPVANQYLGAQ